MNQLNKLWVYKNSFLFNIFSNTYSIKMEYSFRIIIKHEILMTTNLIKKIYLISYNLCKYKNIIEKVWLVYIMP